MTPLGQQRPVGDRDSHDGHSAGHRGGRDSNSDDRHSHGGDTNAGRRTR
jgi:hypothetical protein